MPINPLDVLLAIASPSGYKAVDSFRNADAVNTLLDRYSSNNPPTYSPEAERLLSYRKSPIYEDGTITPVEVRNGDGRLISGGVGGRLAGIPEPVSPIEGYTQRNNIISDSARDMPLDASSRIAVNNHYDTLEKAAVKQYKEDSKETANTELLTKLYPSMEKYRLASEKAGVVPTAAGFFAANPQYVKYSGYDKLNDNLVKEIGMPYTENLRRGAYKGMADNARKIVQSPSEDLANSFDVLAKYPIAPNEADNMVKLASGVTSDSFDKGGAVVPYIIKNGSKTERGERFVSNRGKVEQLGSGVEFDPVDQQLKREGHNIAREQLKHSKDTKEDELLFKIRSEYDAADNLVRDLTTNLLDVADAVKNSGGMVTEKDVITARDNIAKAESKKVSKANDYGRRKWKTKETPVGYDYSFEHDAFFNPNAPQGKRFWRP